MIVLPNWKHTFATSGGAVAEHIWMQRLRTWNGCLRQTLGRSRYPRPDSFDGSANTCSNVLSARRFFIRPSVRGECRLFVGALSVQIESTAAIHPVVRKQYEEPEPMEHPARI